MLMRTRPAGGPAVRLARGAAMALDAGIEGAGHVLAPLLDLLIRLWIAQAFWVSGIVKLNDWDAALNLAANEYPVTWMHPHTAAYIGVAVELLGPVLLVLGLGTRLAALALGMLSLVIQYSYLELNIHLYWAALCGWLVVMGAGPLSLDRRLDLAGTALPLARQASRALALLTRWAGPLYKLFLRWWVGAIFLSSGMAKLADWDSTLFLFAEEYKVPLLPPVLAAWSGTAVEIAAPLLMLAGLGTRLAAVPLMALTLVIQFTYLQHIQHLYWLMLLGLVALHGPGVLSLDALVRRWAERRFPELAGPTGADGQDTLAGLPHVVIVGGGFGGIAAARALARTPCRVTLVDRRNHHLFQPLLYQVATAGLSPADIATPIRALFRDQPNVRVLLGEVTGVDADAREVVLDRGRLPYDQLVLATGAQHGYFGHDEWAPFAPGLKQVEDATLIRRRLLSAFELAEGAATEALRREYLTFVVVGGGPTGVELAGAIAELARHGLAREFRTVDPAQARIILVQAMPRILPALAEPLSRHAKEALEGLGVEVWLDSAVQSVDEAGVVVGAERIPARTVLWAAGVMASPAARWLEAPADAAGRVRVGPDLTVHGRPEIFVVGDTAASLGWDGKPVPGVAPAAKQAGRYAASVIRSRLLGEAAPAPFRYRHPGSLATIGRKAAVADFGRLRLRGAPAWWFWGAVHLLFLVGNRNRIAVAMEWFWAYLTFRRSTRLITGG